MPTIAAVCPRCESQYQVDAALVGKRMRCPNSICRAVFEVKDPAAPPESPAPAVAEKPAGPEKPAPIRPGQQTGNVSDFVPVLPAEAAPPPPARPAQKIREKPRPAPLPPPPAPSEVKPAPPVEEPTPPAAEPPSWEAAPPPVRGEKMEQVVVANDPVPSLEAPEQGLDFTELEGEGGAEEPSPEGFKATQETPASPPEDVPSLETGGHLTKARRRSLQVLVLLGLLLAGLGVGALYLIQGKKASDEAERYQLALKAYDDKEFAQAVMILQGLARDFPESERRKEYRLQAELSDLRSSVHRSGKDPNEVNRSLDRVLEFVDLYKNDSLLKERHGDLWLTLEHLAKDLVEVGNLKQDREFLVRARRAITEAGKFTPPKGFSQAESQAFIEGQVASISKDIRDDLFRKESLALLRSLAEDPSAQAIEAARDLIEARNLQKEGQRILAEMKAEHLARVVFTPAAAASPPLSLSSDPGWNLVLAPVTREIHSPTPEEGPPLLALARGVLYALEPRLGEVRWARRLGVDTRQLPLRIPATLAQPDVLIAVATDPQAVLALSHRDGRELWRHPLSSPSICPPIQVEGRLLVPMLSGQVDEIELISGQFLGFYDLGQPLVVGGARQPGTSLVYLPAAQTCMYVLDVAKRECVQILYLGHAAGSLQGPPLILTEAAPEGAEGKKAGKSWLLLSQAKGQGAQLLRFGLPLESPEAAPVETIPLPAFHTFPPRREGDRLAIAGDDGSLTLFGIRTRGSGGSLRYPYLNEASVHTSPGSPLTPALLAHADAQRWWVLAKGQLYHYQLALSPVEGLQLLSLWGEHPSRDLGSPLHRAEFRVGPGGDSVLLLVTQARDEPTCLASAVDAATGVVRWQRQLGTISQAPPRQAGPHILLHDTRGVFSLSLPGERPPSGWSSLEPGQAEPVGAGQDFFWLPGEGEPSLLTWVRPPAGGTDLKTSLHLHTWSKGKHTSRSWPLLSAPHGTPTRHKDSLVLPLADGTLHQVDLNGDKSTTLRTWRGEGVDQKLPAHVTSLGDAGLAYTDGNLTVTFLHWSSPDAPPSVRDTKKLLYRIIAPPVAVSFKEGEPALALADLSNQITLLRPGDGKILGSWALPGKITAGPALRGDYLVCVVGKNKVIGIDPSQTEVFWQHPCVAQVVGLPERDGGQLVVADWSGKIDWLELKPGLPVARGFTLTPHVVPASAPIAVAGRLLLALSDGTLMALEPAPKEKGKSSTP